MGAGLAFRARNGGHHYEANSLLDNGVVIDLNKLQELTVNEKEGTAVLGAGQKLVSAESGRWRCWRWWGASAVGMFSRPLECVADHGRDTHILLLSATTHL